MILDAGPVSISGNIALYPSLAMNSAGSLGLAWYEYGSPHETDRSDVWLAVQDPAGGWTEPVNVSEGVSYNNGPSLIWLDERECWCCAWHSWRPPGREPFIVDGDVTNIWFRNMSIDRVADEPRRALTDVSNTEYASLAVAPGEGLQLLYRDRSRNLQCLTQPSMGFSFEPGPALPDGLGAGQHGDLAFAPDGTAWIAFVGEGGGIHLASRGRRGPWSQPRRMDIGIDAALSRPKLSLSANGAPWIACHSNTWGSRTSRYRVRTSDSRLDIRLESDGTPGNYCWTCNAISLRGAGGERLFSFGPDAFAPRPGVTAVTAELSVYEPGRGYGFDKPPRSQLRKLGHELTRGLFYDHTPAVFHIDLPDGEYEIEVVHSSWIAPKAGTRISFSGELLHWDLPQQQHDAVYVLQVRPDGGVQSLIVSSGTGCDENRPSKVLHDGRTGRKHIAWTRYGPGNVEVVHASFAVM